MLDDWADRARSMSVPPRLALRRVVFELAGFKGNEAHYYDPENSLLNRVIDRRIGIPITIAIIYLEVARRLHEPAVGVGFPGHFLVRHDDVLIDPFSGGRVVTRRDCEAMLQKVASKKVTIEPWMLSSVTPLAILGRVLTNLKNAYLMKRDLIMAAKAIDRLLIVEPNRSTEIRDRGLIYAELGLANAALSDLTRYLEVSKARDRSVVENLLPSLRAEASKMN
jgi:regulator of sirC expression with transglutaminase-like and TPR domain